MRYDFQCDVCGAVKEVSAHHSEIGSLTPECCLAAMRRVYSAPAFIMPAHKQDQNRDGVLRHREWLKSPEAKKMDLEKASD
jgi:hypothetical protein